MSRSGYDVKLDEQRAELVEARMETARAIGAMRAVEEQLKCARQRIETLEEEARCLRGELGDLRDEMDERSVSPAAEVGQSVMGEPR